MELLDGASADELAVYLPSANRFELEPGAFCPPQGRSRALDRCCQMLLGMPNL
jgi:hypothetical protein